MNITPADISNLEQYASSLIRGRSDIQKEDLVSEAMLVVLEAGGCFEDIKRQIRKALFAETQESKTPETYKAYNSNETRKVCKDCKEDLPISAFHIFRYKNKNKEIISSTCKGCRNAKALKKYHESKDHTVLQKMREYTAAWYEVKKRDPVYKRNRIVSDREYRKNKKTTTANSG